MTFTIEPIDPATWPAIFKVIEPYMARADFTITDLIDQLLAGDCVLWVKRKGGDPIAAAVTELVPSPSGLFVHGRLLAGRGMAGWLEEAIACVTAYAHHQGASKVLIEGRWGWLHVLGAKGWKRKSVVMELPLERAE